MNFKLTAMCVYSSVGVCVCVFFSRLLAEFIFCSRGWSFVRYLPCLCVSSFFVRNVYVCVCIFAVQWTLILCIYVCLFASRLPRPLVRATHFPICICVRLLFFFLSFPFSLLIWFVLALVVGSVLVCRLLDQFSVQRAEYSAYSHLHKYMYLCTQNPF